MKIQMTTQKLTQDKKSSEENNIKYESIINRNPRI